MKNVIGVTIFALIIVALVAAVVFLAGNNMPPMMNTNRTNMTNTSQEQMLTQENQTTTPTQMFITRAELSKHMSRSDCWGAYEGKVYDLTAFLPKYPGSSATVALYCGEVEKFEKAFKEQYGESSTLLETEAKYKGDLQ